jgi:hypothetical protein
MKKIASAVIGLSLALATVGFAAQTAPAATTDNSAPVAKKHVKKTKKAVKNSATPAANSTAAPASAPAHASK